ncbi:MAG: hypothetical protein JWM78_2784 [Verrucomicrobiaceae bacterium]|nr:hypothetical protein [Verrucomicrobiaceae bacterium]
MNFEQMTDQQIWNIANPIMDNLMDASTHIDHARHVRDFTKRISSIVTPEYLERVCKQYQSEKGFFTVRTPVAVFKRPDSAALVWKQYFSKVSGEFVAEIVLVKDGEKYLVDHVMVF